ncbi:MAG: radical SAM protein [Candidatus Glassbacteria bacterium]
MQKVASSIKIPQKNASRGFREGFDTPDARFFSRLVLDLITHPLRKGFTTLWPSAMVFNVTYNCNSRCVMCNNWQRESNDLTADQWSAIFSDPLFEHVEEVGISGGEPTLRKDLPELVAIILEKFSRIRKVQITSNGFLPERVLDIASQCYELCRRSRVRFSFRISLDGIEEVHDRVRNVPGAFKNVEKTLELLREKYQDNGQWIGISSVVMPQNVKSLSHMLEYLKEKDINVLFAPLYFGKEAFDNLDRKEALAYSEEEKLLLIQFFKDLIGEMSLLNPAAYYYDRFVDGFKGAKTRNMACPFKYEGIMLKPDGDIHYCPNSRRIGSLLERSAREIYFDNKNLDFRKKLRERFCKTCFIVCMAHAGLRKEPFPLISWGIRRVWQRMIFNARPAGS